MSDNLCMKSDNQIIRNALLSRCRILERTLERNVTTGNERRVLQDEYERTFALTERYQRGEPP